MITIIANAPESPLYKQGSLIEFYLWLTQQWAYQIDIETDLELRWCDKILITVQFGSMDGKDQWLLQWSALSEEQKIEVRRMLNNCKKMKLAHNGAYEYIVLRFHGIILENIYDTMLVEKVLNGGLNEGVDYGLADLTERYLCKRLDKTEQKNFGDDVLTESKVVYAVTDVQYLGFIRTLQLLELHQQDLEYVAALENEALLSFSDITYEGQMLDVVKWRENIGLAQPLVDDALDKLNAWLVVEPFRTVAIKNKHVSDSDQVTINWNSPHHKRAVFDTFFPEIQGSTKAVVTRFVKNNPWHEGVAILKAYSEGRFELLQQWLLDHCKPWLIQNNFMIPAGTVTINWGSPTQVLPVLQSVEPTLKSTNAEALGRTTHPCIADLEEYRDNLKLVGTYGEEFLAQHLNSDGRIRTTFDQIKETGRVSSAKPNMQNIPAKEAVGNRYRNCFIPELGWEYVSSDYVSQELIIIAVLSSDAVWKEALSKGQDLHSVVAEMVFGKKWKDAAEDDCAYYLNGAKKKCSCNKHKYMRNGTKTIDFGLCYGMSHFKLAGTLRISIREAKQLINDFFRAFPGIERLLNSLGSFGVRRGYIMTIAPFFRKRWFPTWRFARGHINEHLSEMKYNSVLGSIERQSKNQPIQGTAADQMKTAMCLVRAHLVENGLFGTHVKMVMQVHDQLDTVAITGYAEQWKPKFTELMEEAALLNIPTGLLKADTQITPIWTK